MRCNGTLKECTLIHYSMSIVPIMIGKNKIVRDSGGFDKTLMGGQFSIFCDPLLYTDIK